MTVKWAESETFGAMRASLLSRSIRGTPWREKRQSDEELFTSHFDRGSKFAFVLFSSSSSSYCSSPLKAPQSQRQGLGMYLL